MISNNQQLIQTHKPKSLVNRCGYRLDDVMGNNRLDMAKLLVGTEGTLGIITEATIRTSRLPKHSGLILLACERLENAANAAQLIRKYDIAACDLMDRRLLQLACESDERYNHVLPKTAEAILLVEKTGESFAEVREGLQQIAKQTRQKKLAFDSKIALEHDDVELLCRLTHRVVPTLYRLKGSTRPLPFVEDIAIPPDELPSFLVRVQNVLKKHQVTASLFAHAAHGQLHIRPFLDLADPEHVRRMQHLARDLYAEVLDVKGTISGEHADGLSRTWFVREQYGPLYDVFVQLKQLFDPQNRLNPGKIIDESGQSLAQNLRPVQIMTSQTELSDSSEPDALIEENETPPSKPIVQLELNWTPDDMTLAARSCNGCGGCRTTSDIERMCPMFRIAPAEEATPRAKANLMRAIMTGRLDPEVLGSDAISDIADLCFHCHQCRVECPASVDIPKLVTECKCRSMWRKGLP
ncbi:MAG: FAD-binding and (Fe-S)-binding domain-containing protein [Pirellulaceae bacterium]